MLQKTYEIMSGPPAMGWEEYKAIIQNEWDLLLNSDCGEEKVFQNFLERHPCMMPGPFGLIGSSGHSPYPAAIITQPSLPDYTRRVPDFMWIARNSETIYPILIEIESPSKLWFNRDDRQSAKLNQARDQITEWMAWFKNPLNMAQFKEYYDIQVRGETIHPLFLLIYGRTEEATSTIDRQRRRSSLRRDDEFLMTYDRLVPQPQASQFYTVRRDRHGYKAVYVPPTVELGPLLAHERARISNKSEAVEQSPYFSSERRGFLISRMPYWDDWTMKRSGIIHTSDRE